MAKQKLSQRNITFVKTGGYVHIIVPAITPGNFDSYRIPITALLSGVGNTPIQLTSQTGNITQAISANTWIDKISIFQAGGAPVVRIGTTPNGEDVMTDATVTTYAQVKPEVYTLAGNTLYFTINGGSVDIRIDTNTGYNGSI